MPPLPKIGKNQAKEGKIRKNRDKRGKIGKKRQKSGRLFYFAPPDRQGWLRFWFIAPNYWLPFGKSSINKQANKQTNKRYVHVVRVATRKRKKLGLF